MDRAKSPDGEDWGAPSWRWFRPTRAGRWTALENLTEALVRGVRRVEGLGIPHVIALVNPRGYFLALAAAVAECGLLEKREHFNAKLAKTAKSDMVCGSRLGLGMEAARPAPVRCFRNALGPARLSLRPLRALRFNCNVWDQWTLFHVPAHPRHLLEGVRQIAPIVRAAAAGVRHAGGIYAIPMLLPALRDETRRYRDRLPPRWRKWGRVPTVRTAEKTWTALPNTGTYEKVQPFTDCERVSLRAGRAGGRGPARSGDRECTPGSRAQGRERR